MSGYNHTYQSSAQANSSCKEFVSQSLRLNEVKVKIRGGYPNIISFGKLYTKMPQGEENLVLRNVVHFPPEIEPREFLDEAEGLMTIRHVSSGITVVTAGEDAKCVFFVLRGGLKVVSGDGDESFADLSQGALFGEIGAILAMKRTASVISTTECLLGVLLTSQLNSLLGRYPKVKQYMMGKIEERLLELQMSKGKKGEKLENLTKWDLVVSVPKNGSQAGWDYSDGEDSGVCTTDALTTGIKSISRRNSTLLSPPDSLQQESTPRRRSRIATVIGEADNKWNRRNSMFVRAENSNKCDYESRISKVLPRILNDLERNKSVVDLSSYNSSVTDEILNSILKSGNNIEVLFLSNCCFLTSNCVMSIGNYCPNLKSLCLSNIWNTKDSALLYLVSKLKNLRELDLSNIRIISNSTILAIVRELPNIDTLILSYCKSITASALATRKWSKIIKVNFQRCTGILGCGFYMWYFLQTNRDIDGLYNDVMEDIEGAPREVVDNVKKLGKKAKDAEHKLNFQEEETDDNNDEIGKRRKPSTYSPEFKNGKTSWRLKELILSDCTLLDDFEIITLIKVCTELTKLSLSFCCALTGAAIYVMSKLSKNLKVLDLSFCGNAVTNDSLKYLCDLKSLEAISIRGCVQISQEGLEYYVKNSQIKYLAIGNCMDTLEEEAIAEKINSTIRNVVRISNTFDINSCIE